MKTWLTNRKHCVKVLQNRKYQKGTHWNWIYRRITADTSRLKNRQQQQFLCRRKGRSSCFYKESDSLGVELRYPIIHGKNRQVSYFNEPIAQTNVDKHTDWKMLEQWKLVKSSLTKQQVMKLTDNLKNCLRTLEMTEPSNRLRTNPFNKSFFSLVPQAQLELHLFILVSHVIQLISQLEKRTKSFKPI